MNVALVIYANASKVIRKFHLKGLKRITLGKLESKWPNDILTYDQETLKAAHEI